MVSAGAATSIRLTIKKIAEKRIFLRNIFIERRSDSIMGGSFLQPGGCLGGALQIQLLTNALLSF